jgi:hypothetical protein
MTRKDKKFCRKEGDHGEEGGVEMMRLRRAMALWGRISIPFFKGR